MEGWMWLVLASMFIVGGLFGAVFARSRRTSNTQQVSKLEGSLNDARTELKDYRSDVAQHFGKTAELFDTLTNDYRAVHEHLATSSEALCGDQAAKLGTSAPENRRLDDAPKQAQPEPEATTPELEKSAAESETKEEKVADETVVETSTEQVASAEPASEETEEKTKAPANIDDKATEARTIH